MNALTRTIVVGLICLILLGVVGYELYFIKGADTAVRKLMSKLVMIVVHEVLFIFKTTP